jgi:hypothetical protein
MKASYETSSYDTTEVSNVESILNRNDRVDSKSPDILPGHSKFDVAGAWGPWSTRPFLNETLLEDPLQTSSDF